MMRSPFPGMDPYLESHWGDVHTSLVTYARDQLCSRLSKVLRIRTEECVKVQGEANDGSSEPRIERWLKIVDTTAASRVVTVIEFLSPWNKRSPGREAYHTKQQDLLDGEVNLVEIDLTRSGLWALAAPEHDVPENYRLPYAICVKRPASSDFEMYQTSLPKPLPTIRIPLRSTDPDIPLEIQKLVDSAYANGGYEDDLNYAIPPVPHLSPQDEQWANKLLTECGLR